jgi:hypothetical protein
LVQVPVGNYLDLNIEVVVQQAEEMLPHLVVPELHTLYVYQKNYFQQENFPLDLLSFVVHFGLA